MGKNIAIVVGISKYDMLGNDLPGCKNDADTIYKTLILTKKYDDILFRKGDVKSYILKDDIGRFVNKYQTQEVDEIFFYYSGHGLHMENEFCFITTDYRDDRQRSTSLMNSELDDLLKSVGSSLVVKFIDACQSGTRYVKDINNINNYVKSTGADFQDCYFFFSSQNNQSSYQTDKISFFTKSFVKAIVNSQIQEIKYRYIEDSIADDFKGEIDQTPYFVHQGSATELFCIRTKELLDFLSSQELFDNIKDENSISLSLIERIELDSKTYFSKNELYDKLEYLKYNTNGLVLNETARQLYDLECIYEKNYNDIKSSKEIGSWLAQNRNTLFAQPKYSTIKVNKYGMPANSYTNSLSLFNDDKVYESIEVSGFETSIDMPFNTIRLVLKPKYLNIPDVYADVVFLCNHKRIRFFYYITKNEVVDGGKTQYDNNIRWETIECQIENETEIRKFFQTLLIEIQTLILKKLEDMFLEKI